jgi:ATP-dependent exoDNAse (exonuclease V) alpha subunit
LRPKRLLKPLNLPIHKGLSLYMTKNVRKDTDYVNGMRCIVEAYDTIAAAVIVIIGTGRRVAITKRNDEEIGLSFYPLRPGYASTVMKFQGAELSHVIVYLDKPHVPAAAYTAMSRVRMQAHCLIGGFVTPDHFTPAR